MTDTSVQGNTAKPAISSPTLPTQTGRAATPQAAAARPGWLLAIVLTGQFMAILDVTIVNAAAPTHPVATPGAGTLDLAKIDTEDIELITQTAFLLCTGDPEVLTGRIAHTQTFLREVGWLT